METSILRSEIYTDFKLQKGLVIINAICCIISTYNHVCLVFLLMFQFVVGFYQMVSSMVGLFTTKKHSQLYKWRQRHFFGSLAYIVFLYLIADNRPFEDFFHSHKILTNVVLVLIGIVIPQMIMYAYFYLTYLWMKEDEQIEQYRVLQTKFN